MAGDHNFYDVAFKFETYTQFLAQIKLVEIIYSHLHLYCVGVPLGILWYANTKSMGKVNLRACITQEGNELLG